MYNLGNFMQYYHPQFMQAQPGIQQQGYSQQSPGGYQPAQPPTYAAPAMMPQPGSYQGQPPQASPGLFGNPAQRPMFQPRMNLGMFNSRPAAY